MEITLLSWKTMNFKFIPNTDTVELKITNITTCAGKLGIEVGRYDFTIQRVRDISLLSIDEGI